MIDELADRDWVSQILVSLLVLVVAWAAERAIAYVLQRLYWARVTRGVTARHADELRRSQQQQTLVSVLQGLVRYIVFAVAVVVIVGIYSKRDETTFFSASVFVLVVGFGLQRLFGEMVAGALLIFEGHYVVGDYVSLEPSGSQGFVDEFSLRTTVLRTLEGDRIAVMNGAITSAKRMRGGFRDYRLEMVVAGEAVGVRERLEGVLARAEASAQQRYLLGPRIDELEPFEAADGELRIELRAVVPPSLEWMVEEHLVSSLREVLGDSLRGDIGVHTTSDAAFDLYRSAVLVPD